MSYMYECNLHHLSKESLLTFFDTVCTNSFGKKVNIGMFHFVGNSVHLPIADTVRSYVSNFRTATKVQDIVASAVVEANLTKENCTSLGERLTWISSMLHKDIVIENLVCSYSIYIQTLVLNKLHRL
jgi:hypothetical protein